VPLLRPILSHAATCTFRHREVTSSDETSYKSPLSAKLVVSPPATMT
jgi:hypothetical protein